MKFTKLAITMLCALVVFCGCAKNSDVVIKVNNTEITRGEFYGDFEKIKSVQVKNLPKEFQQDNSFTVLSMKEKFVNDTILRALVSEEFAKRNITVTPKEVNERKAKLIAQVGSEEQFNNILKSSGITEAKMLEDLESEAKLDKLVKTLEKGNVSDSEALKYYNKNKTAFTLPKRVRASHILINTDENALKRELTESDKEGKLSTAEIDKKAKEEAQRREKLVNEIRQKAANNPKNFAQLAKEYSQDPGSAQKGGDLGFFVKEQMVPEFANAAFTQKVGVVGPVVKTQFGKHIILVTDKAAGGLQPFNSVKEDIKVYLGEQKKFMAFQKFVKGLKDNATIEFYDESLKPDVLRKQIEESLSKKMSKEKYENIPASKKKTLEKMQEQK